MEKFDYLYFYKNDLEQNIPLITGSSNDLSQVLWINHKQKKDLQILSGKPLEEIYVFFEGTEFVVKEGRS